MRNHKIKIIPIPDPRLVPRYLIDQIKEKTWDTDEWYEFNLQQIRNPDNLILGLVDETNLVKGIVWISVDKFNKYVFVNNLSLDKKLQFDKKLFEDIHRYLNSLSVKLNLKTVYWITKRPKAFEAKGYKRSEYVLLEGEVEHGSRK